MSHTKSEKEKLLNRVRRVRGQIEAVERALETDEGCATVLHLIVDGARRHQRPHGRGDRRSYPDARGRSGQGRRARARRRGAHRSGAILLEVKIMSMTQATPAAHSHTFLGEGHEQNERRTWLVIWLCGFMMVGEIIGGIAVRLDRAGGGRPAHVHPCERALAGRARLSLRPPARGRPALHVRHRQARRPRRLYQRDRARHDRASSSATKRYRASSRRFRSASIRRSRSRCSGSPSMSPACCC